MRIIKSLLVAALLPVSGRLAALWGTARWDLPAGKMSRMAHGGCGLEVDPHPVWKSQSKRSHRASSIRWMRLTGRRSGASTSFSLSASTSCERR